MSDNWVVQNLQNALDTWNSKLSEIWQLLTTSPQDFKGGSIWNVMVTINGAVQAIGLALLVLFFVVGVVRTCGSFTEVKKPEHALKLFIRFAIAKGVITYGLELMLALFNIVQGTISTISIDNNGGVQFKEDGLVEIISDYNEKYSQDFTIPTFAKGAVLDAVDEGLIERDPTRKAIIKGKKPRQKKIKYLNQFELHKLLSVLELNQELNWDWFILLVAKTGMRFSEALAITPNDFDFSKQSLSINKTWDYKGNGGFMPTKNQSSVRRIQIDWQLIIQFSTLVKDLPQDEPIFISGKVYNSTVNDILTRHCKKAGIPIISIHGLRHTHASLLLFAGVSIASVAQRLGHSSMTTTQKTYLHIIQELENKDVDLVMRSLSSLN